MNFPDKKYQIIYSDLPYKYNDKALAGNRGASSKYDTMTIEEMMQLPVQQIADKDCFLFEWTTWPMIRETFKILDEWKFEYVTIAFLWIKKNMTGTVKKSMG